VIAIDDARIEKPRIIKTLAAALNQSKKRKRFFLFF
jgi:hypothetical protein